MRTKYLIGEAYSRYAVDRAPVNMCRCFLLLALVYLQLKASTESPPRVSACRMIYKSKEHENYKIPSTWGACDTLISLQIPREKAINITDIRNCENFYQCQGYSCHQCPCPIGQTFNPKTLICDESQPACECPHSAKITAGHDSPSQTTWDVPSKPVTQTAVNISHGTIPPSTNNRPQNSADLDKQEVIIISGIVSGTAVLIVVIVSAACLWQKNRRRRRQTNEPRGKSSPPSTEEFSSTEPPSEGHVYAEINEHVKSNKHWQQGGSMRIPVLPDHPPPEAHSPPCPIHSYSDSGISSADTCFTESYPARDCFHGGLSGSNCVSHTKDNPEAFQYCHEQTSTKGSSVSNETQHSCASQQASSGIKNIHVHHHNSMTTYMSQEAYI